MEARLVASTQTERRACLYVPVRVDISRLPPALLRRKTEYKDTRREADTVRERKELEKIERRAARESGAGALGRVGSRSRGGVKWHTREKDEERSGVGYMSSWSALKN